jgi:hypothetical protein
MPGSRDHFKCSGKDKAAMRQLSPTFEWDSECVAAPRTGTGDIPFITDAFMLIPPKYRVDEYITLYGNQLSPMGSFSDFDCDNGESCYRTACAYYTRGVALANEYGEGIMEKVKGMAQGVGNGGECPKLLQILHDTRRNLLTVTLGCAACGIIECIYNDLRLLYTCS